MQTATGPITNQKTYPEENFIEMGSSINYTIGIVLEAVYRE